MTEIFGEGARLNSIHHAILMTDEAETYFDKGYVVIVRNVDEQSPAAISFWHQSSPQSFKIRVVDPNAKGMDNYYESKLVFLLLLRFCFSYLHNSPLSLKQL